MSPTRRLEHVTILGVLVLCAMGTAAHAAGKPAFLHIFGKKTRTDFMEHSHPSDKCDHDVHMIDRELRRGQDSMHWLIWNDCEDRPVLLCVYPENPFERCKGGDIGTPFSAPTGVVPTHVSCKTKKDAKEGEYKKQALIGLEIPTTKKCPPSPLPELAAKGGLRPLTHTLDIVIEP